MNKSLFVNKSRWSEGNIDEESRWILMRDIINWMNLITKFMQAVEMEYFVEWGHLTINDTHALF